MNIKSHEIVRNDFIWTTREGIEWLLKDMHDRHIRNCIGHCDRVIRKRSKEIADEYIQVFKDEITYRRKEKIKKLYAITTFH